MMTHENGHDEWAGLVPEYAAGQLKGLMRDNVEAHLASSVQCREELEGWLAVAGVLTPDAESTTDQSVEAGWSRLVATLPPRRVVAMKARTSRALCTVEVGTFEDTQSSGSIAGPIRPLPRAGLVRATLRRVLAVATVVIVVGSFAALGAYQLAGLGRSPLPAGEWVRTSAPLAPTGLPTATIHSDSTLLSASEGWAASSIVDLDRETGDYVVKQGHILHYQDGHWKVSPDSPASIQLLQFWTSAPGRLWARGDAHSGGPTPSSYTI
ncbi:MAG TPA: zf-HC2 domain-containing protein [Ktedonobacterales bacterium]|jgi:hypothetical protein|nr:zf-HC2 domain-containing protein [Ktedonobacterales bacterium]